MGDLANQTVNNLVDTSTVTPTTLNIGESIKSVLQHNANSKENLDELNRICMEAYAKNLNQDGLSEEAQANIRENMKDVIDKATEQDKTNKTFLWHMMHASILLLLIVVEYSPIGAKIHFRK